MAGAAHQLAQALTGHLGVVCVQAGQVLYPDWSKCSKNHVKKTYLMSILVKMTDPRVCDGPAVADVQAGQCLSRAELSRSQLGKA